MPYLETWLSFWQHDMLGIAGIETSWGSCVHLLPNCVVIHNKLSNELCTSACSWYSIRTKLGRQQLWSRHSSDASLGVLLDSKQRRQQLKLIIFRLPLELESVGLLLLGFAAFLCLSSFPLLLRCFLSNQIREVLQHSINQSIFNVLGTNWGSTDKSSVRNKVVQSMAPSLLLNRCGIDYCTTHDSLKLAQSLIACLT